MTQHRPRAPHGLFVVTTLLLAGCSSGSPGAGGMTAAPAPADAPASSPAAVQLKQPNTLEGIYTPAQAERGREVYEDICSGCHKTEDWQDERFLARWEGESVYRFWFYIYENMPEGEPPYSLPREQVSDVLTYILELNEVPAGDAELGSDDDSIDVHWLYWKSPAS